MAVTRIEIPAEYAMLMNGNPGHQYLSNVQPVGLFRPNTELSNDDLDRFFDELVRIGYFADDQTSGSFSESAYRIILGCGSIGGPV